MTLNMEFNPNWNPTPPGETLLELMDAEGVSLEVLASEIGEPQSTLKKVLNGSIQVDNKLAILFSSFFGGTSDFWIEREKQFSSKKFFLNPEPELIEPNTWLKQIPYAELVNLGWVNRYTKPSLKIDELYKFFGINSVKEWYEKYENLTEVYSFRTSDVFPNKVGATAAWMRRGENYANSLNVPEWDANEFINSIERIRKLSREKDIERALSKLEKICRNTGLILFFSRPPKGCRASGVTYFSKNGNPVIQMSFRFLSDDHFWFTLFHEFGHALDKKIQVSVEDEDAKDNDAEKRANEFAMNSLISPANYHELMTIKLNKWSIARFARNVSLSPGIVVGQLQHHGRISYKKFNKLKKRFTWDELERAFINLET